MRYLLLLMAAPQFAFAGTLASHSNDFKALEVLEASQPPAAPPARKPAAKPKPKPAPAPKPAPPEPSAEAKALDALMAAGPEAAPAPVAEPKPAPKHTARKTVAVKRPLRIVAKAAKPKVRVKVRLKPAPDPQEEPELNVVELDPLPPPVKKSRYINYAKTTPKPASKPVPKFAMSAPTPKSAPVPAKIEFTEDAPAPAPTVAAVVPTKASADSEALDALIESTPDTPRSALRGPIQIPAGEAADVQVEEEQESRPARANRRYANDDDGGLIDPNEIQRVAPRKIQNVWY